MIENTHPSIQGGQFPLTGMPSVPERGKITSHFSFQPNCILFPAGDAELQGMERGTDPTPSPRSDRSWTPTGISAGTRSLPPRDASVASHRHVTHCEPAGHQAKASTFHAPTRVSENPTGSSEPGERFLQQSSAAGVWPSKKRWVKTPPETRCHLSKGSWGSTSTPPWQSSPGSRS